MTESFISQSEITLQQCETKRESSVRAQHSLQHANLLSFCLSAMRIKPGEKTGENFKQGWVHFMTKGCFLEVIIFVYCL